MGDEITQLNFTEEDDDLFRDRLDQEMGFVRQLFHDRQFDQHTRRIGYELEICLLDQQGRPAPFNQQVLDDANNPLFTYELARFNLEINGHAFEVDNQVFNHLSNDMRALYQQVDDSARRYQKQAGLFGVLPSLEIDHLDMDGYMSNMSRYRHLNNRLMSMRDSPVQLDILGMDHLQLSKDDVMLEALGTSLQIHYQIPFDEAVDTYHAALWASLPVMAACANSPLVLQHSCWQESRIVIFKHAVDCRTDLQKMRGELPRVFLARGYIDSWQTLFEDNLYFKAVLPEVMDTPTDELHHLNLHNGTIWRWIRPIMGGDPHQGYHLRLELRVTPAGPSLIDTMANTVFYIGLIEGLKQQPKILTRIPFETLEKGFYQSARLGLNAEVNWCHGGLGSMQQILLNHAIPLAHQGLINLGFKHETHYLDIIQQRVLNQQTGARWTTQFWNKYHDVNSLVTTYQKHARLNIPVHLWPKP